VPSSCIKANPSKDILKTGARLFKECYNAQANQQQAPKDPSVMESVTPAPTGAPESALKKVKKTVTIADPPAVIHKPPGYKPPVAQAQRLAAPPTPTQTSAQALPAQRLAAPAPPPQTTSGWSTSFADLRKAANAWDDMVSDAHASQNASLVPPYWKAILESEPNATDPRVILNGFIRFLDTQWFAKGNKK
jgi:hypothetical protein